jgi:hypothetical protein
VSIGSVARIAGYALLALLTLEVAARVEDFVRYRASLTAPYSINTIFRSSPYSREGKPGARFAKWSLNSLGFRGPEIVAGRTNVIVFGASETFGIYESPGAEYPRQLEATLNARQSDRYNVINIAIPGMRIGRVGYLDRAIHITNAKYVVVYPTPANYIGTTAAFCAQPNVPVPDRLGWADYVRLAGRMEQVAKTNTPPSLLTALRRLSISMQTLHVDVMERVPQASIDAFRSDLLCVTNLAKSLGVEPILLTHATYFGATMQPEDKPMMVTWRRFYPELSEGGFLDLERRANDAIRAVGRDAGVKVVDAARLIPGGPKYFADFAHFTDLGAHCMAALIAAQLGTRQTSTTGQRIN